MHDRVLAKFVRIAFVGLYLVAGSAFAAPVAIVTDLQGRAELDLADQSSAVNILDNLEPDSRIDVGEDNAITLVYYDSGVEYTYAGPATFVVSQAQPKLITGNGGQSKALKALENTGLKPADNVVQAATVFRSAEDSRQKLTLLSPADTKILETRPEFTWVGLKDKVSYRFVLRTLRGQTVYEDSISDNRLTLPNNNALRFGRKYIWEVSTTSGGEGYYGNASFQVGAQSEIESLKENLPASSATFSEKAVYTLLLKQHGFIQAAKEKWEALKKERPEQAKASTLFE